MDLIIKQYPLTPTREPRIRSENSSISDDVIHVTQKNSTFLFVSVRLFLLCYVKSFEIVYKYDSMFQNFSDQLTSSSPIKRKPEELINFGSSTPNKESPTSSVGLRSSESSLSKRINENSESDTNVSELELSNQSSSVNQTEDLLFSSSNQSSVIQSDLISAQDESITKSSEITDESVKVVDVPVDNVDETCDIEESHSTEKNTTNVVEYKVSVVKITDFPFSVNTVFKIFFHFFTLIISKTFVCRDFPLRVQTFRVYRATPAPLI